MARHDLTVSGGERGGNHRRRSLVNKPGNCRATTRDDLIVADGRPPPSPLRHILRWNKQCRNGGHNIAPCKITNTSIDERSLPRRRQHA